MSKIGSNLKDKINSFSAPTNLQKETQEKVLELEKIVAKLCGIKEEEEEQLKADGQDKEKKEISEKKFEK